MAAAFLELAERVHEASLHQRSEPRALLDREAVVAHVVLRPREIVLRVRHVQVAAENHRLRAFQRLEVLQKIAVPLLPVVQPRQFPLRIRHIDIHEEKIRKFRREHTSLAVVLGHADASRHGQRLGAAEDERPRVALLLRPIPMRSVARRPLDLDDLRRSLRLLHAHDVRLLGIHKIKKALLQRRTDAIHIPRDEFHVRGGQRHIGGEGKPARRDVI